MIDPASYLRQFLVSDAGVQAQVSIDARGAVRIYVGGLGSGIPQVDASLMPRKAVVLLLSGGSPVGRRMPLIRPVVWIRCYGASVLEAMQVYGAVYDVLHRAQNEKVAVGASKAAMYWAEINVEPQVLPEPVTEWPCVGTPFQMVFYESTV